MSRISVIIPSWNGRHLLPACLEALADQNEPDLEILVVDNGSGDGTIAWLGRAHPQVRCVKLPRNTGFTGAVNAFTEKTNSVKDLLSGEYGEVPAVARHYKAEGLRWVVVGDENYGEGSSREHAAMCPRHLGCAAVIVRSFARIHETNLKKQGVLPLTFIDPADYDKVQEGDRMDILGLADLAPDHPVTMIIHHTGGGSDEVMLNHTLTAEQIAWFVAGSALNKIKESKG